MIGIGPENLITSIKTQVKRTGPGMFACGVKNRLLESAIDRLRYPRTAVITAAGLQYGMVVHSQREEYVITGSCFEQEMIEEMIGSLEPDSISLDVGAAGGTHTLALALSHERTGTVYAVEPDDECFSALGENCKLNGVSNVIPMKIALWDKDTELFLETGGIRGAAPRILEQGDPYTKQLGHAAHISARSIASLVQSGEMMSPNLVKIDVEGKGMHVLHGMGAIRPAHVFFEVHPMMGESMEEVSGFMKERGYVIVNEPRIRDGEIHVHFRFSDA